MQVTYCVRYRNSMLNMNLNQVEGKQTYEQIYTRVSND